MNDHRAKFWPALPYEEWRDTATTLHLWTQIAGKIRLKQSAWVNHSWHVTLYVSPSGLTTGPIPHGERTFSLDFDFRRHRFVIRACQGEQEAVPLQPQTTAAFYGQVMKALQRLDLDVAINRRPNEVEPAIPFDVDEVHSSYDPEWAYRFWRALLQVDRVFHRFRAQYLGKSSPVHFFWGSFDHAVTRFSGRRAPAHPGGIPNLPDAVTREAYSHEVSSAGFWPGGEALPEPIFYSYAYPAPAAFRDAAVRPREAYWHEALGEFVLPYEAVRTSEDPEAMLLAFLQTTYEAAATTADWDRAQLETTGLAPE
jgi:hypothetical protein